MWWEWKWISPLLWNVYTTCNSCTWCLCSIWWSHYPIFSYYSSLAMSWFVQTQCLLLYVLLCMCTWVITWNYIVNIYYKCENSGEVMEVYHDTRCVGLAPPLLLHATTNNFREGGSHIYHSHWNREMSKFAIKGLVVSSFELALIQTLTSPPNNALLANVDMWVETRSWYACMGMRGTGDIHTIMYLHHDIRLFHIYLDTACMDNSEEPIQSCNTTS